MADGNGDFFADLERELVDATRGANSRRRQGTVVRAAVPAMLAVGLTALALGGVPGASSANALGAVATAAAATAPSWASAEAWSYTLDTSVGASGAESTGTYLLADVSRRGDQARVDERRAASRPPVKSTGDLAAGFQGERSGTLPSQARTTSIQSGAFSELPVAADDLPTSKDGFRRLAQQVSYGSTCGEKTMHLAKDVLRVPGLDPAARHAIVEALGDCPDLTVLDGARDPLGRTGTSIAVTGEGPGIKTTTALMLDAHNGQPLSIVQSADQDEPKLDIVAGAVLDAQVFRYTGE